MYHCIDRRVEKYNERLYNTRPQIDVKMMTRARHGVLIKNATIAVFPKPPDMWMMIEDSPHRRDDGDCEQGMAHKSAKVIINEGKTFVERHQASTSCQIWWENEQLMRRR